MARISEGLALRKAGVANAIVLLEGIFSHDELQQAASERFELVVHEAAQIALLEQAVGTHHFNVWLKLNTGMNRLGFIAEEFQHALRRLEACASVRQIRLMTHLAGAEEPGGDSARWQIEKFLALTDGMKFERSVANSAGLIAWPAARTEWVTAGFDVVWHLADSGPGRRANRSATGDDADNAVDRGAACSARRRRRLQRDLEGLARFADRDCCGRLR